MFFFGENIKHHFAPVSVAVQFFIYSFINAKKKLSCMRRITFNN